MVDVDPAAQGYFYDYGIQPEYYSQQGPYLTDQSFSSYSQYTGSQYSDQGKASQSESVRAWAGVCIFIVVCLIFGVITVLLIALHPDDSDIAEESANGSSAPSGINVPPPLEHTLATVPTRAITAPRRRVRPPRPTRRSTARPVTPNIPVGPPFTGSHTLPPVQTPTTTTQPPPLLCSVGSPAAAIQPLYPPDRACDIVFLTHVRVINNTVRAVIARFSFPTFRNACATYRDTTCGLSFDVYFLNPEVFYPTELMEYLEELRTVSHINHYGVLNVYGTPAFVENISLAMQFTEAITEMRNVLGDDRKNHKVVVGVGYYFYNDSNSWENLANTVEKITSYDVDIVTIITTPLSQPDRRQCITLPVNAIDSQNDFVPTMEAAFRMAEKGFAKPSVVIAFALQMGVLYYTLNQEYDLPVSAAYQPCTGFGVTDYAQACQADTSELTFEKTVIGISSSDTVELFGGRRLFQTHDTLDLMEMKARTIMSKQDIRDNFTWFLFNVHLTDFTRSCLPSGPFERLKGFRDFYYREVHMLKG